MIRYTSELEISYFFQGVRQAFWKEERRQVTDPNHPELVSAAYNHGYDVGRWLRWVYT